MKPASFPEARSLTTLARGIVLFASLTGAELAAQKLTAIPFRQDSLYRFVNPAGKETSPGRYQDVSITYDGRFKVTNAKLVGLVDSLGVERVKPPYNGLDVNETGFVPIRDRRKQGD